MMKVEIRTGSVTIDGYVNAVGRESRVLPSPQGPFVEQVEPRTFTKALNRGKNVELRFNHKKVLGSTKDRSLRLTEDNIGLRATAEVTDPEVIEKARNGELRGWSFGFCALQEEWRDAENGMKKRILQDIELREVSILDKTPAYIATSIEERGEESVLYEERGFEDSSEVTDHTPKPPKDTGEEQRSLLAQKLKYLKLKGK